MSILDNTPVNKPTAVWSEPLPVNRLEMLQAAQLEDALGLTSKETLRRDIGRDAELEAQRLADEQRDSDARQDEMLRRQSERGFGDAMIGAGNEGGE